MAQLALSSRKAAHAVPLGSDPTRRFPYVKGYNVLLTLVLRHELQSGHSLACQKISCKTNHL